MRTTTSRPHRRLMATQASGKGPNDGTERMWERGAKHPTVFQRRSAIAASAGKRWRSPSSTHARRSPMRSHHCLVIASILVGSGAAALACSSGKKTEFTGTTSGSSGEELSTSDFLSHAHVMPVARLASRGPKKAQPFAGVPGPAGAQLTYRGGPLIQSVKVYTVFWGSGIANQTQLGDYYTAITNSAYFDWLVEYNANGQTISRGTFGGGFVDPSPPSSTSITNQDIQNELERLLSAG